MGTIGIAVLAFLSAVLLLRILTTLIDHFRIRRSLRKSSFQIQSIRWSPFGRGWTSSHGERIYKVHYLDNLGIEHTAYCKISLFSGIYWSLKQSSKQQLQEMVNQLRIENAELKAEIQRLTHNTK